MLDANIVAQEVSRPTAKRVRLSYTTKRGKVITTVQGQVFEYLKQARYATPEGTFLALGHSKSAVEKAFKDLRDANLIHRIGIGCYMVK